MPDGALVRIRHAGRTVPMPARVRITDDVLWLLGLWVAEGCAHERGKSAFVTISGDDALLDRAEAIVRRELGLHVVRAPASPARAASLFVHSKLLLRLLDYLGFDGNRKRIPGWILGLPLEPAEVVHRGLPRGRRRALGQEVRRGRPARVLDRARRAQGRPDRRVRALRPRPVGRPLRDEVPQQDRRSRVPVLAPDAGACQPVEPARVGRRRRAAPQARRTGDLVWAPVTSIREVEPTPLVYDFSVPGLENFWAGTGVMAHNTYGPRMRRNDGRASVTFLHQALEGKPLTVFGDGSQTRSLCYVDDLIRGLHLLALSGEHLPVNLGNPDHEMTMLELAQACIRVDRLVERDRVRGAADGRPDGAPAGHHARAPDPRLAARDRPRRGPQALDPGARLRAGRSLRREKSAPEASAPWTLPAQPPA